MGAEPEPRARARGILPRMDPLAIVADVTDMETRPPRHPDHVAAMEARGFRVLGRFATLARPSQNDMAYGRQQRTRLEDWRQRTAATAMVAPDGTSFAGVDTFGEARMLRLRSELDDGSVVETVGVERDGVLMPRFGRDPLESFKLVATPDHFVRLIEDPTPDAVIAEHQAHVTDAAAIRGAEPVRHADRDHALRLATLHVDHMTRTVHRGQRVTRLALFGVFVVLVAAMLAYQSSAERPTIAVLLFDLAMVLIAVIVAIGVSRLMMRWTRWRPAYVVDR
jgi:hypothetical protein